MTQQRGMKRARKVLARTQAKAKATRKTNIKQAIYAYEKAVKAAEAGGEAEHVHGPDCKHEHK